MGQPYFHCVSGKVPPSRITSPGVSFSRWAIWLLTVMMVVISPRSAECAPAGGAAAVFDKYRSPASPAPRRWLASSLNGEMGHHAGFDIFTAVQWDGVWVRHR